MIKSLFLDIDGTLVSLQTHDIPASTIDALTRAKRNGVKVFISTGRPPMIITNLGAISHLIDGYITTNGAYCYVGEHTVCVNAIDPHDVKAIRRDADEHDYTCLVIGQHDLALYNPKPIFQEVFGDELKVQNIDLEKPAEPLFEQPVLQFTPFFPETHEASLMSKMPHCVSGRWHPAFTDITSIAADKGNGLQAMAEHLGLNLSETMAFGDGGNDLAIIKKAGIGVAMGNSKEGLKVAADYVTTSVDDDGIANALAHFKLI